MKRLALAIKIVNFINFEQQNNIKMFMILKNLVKIIFSNANQNKLCLCIFIILIGYDRLIRNLYFNFIQKRKLQ